MNVLRSIFKWAHLPLLTGACIVVGAAGYAAFEAHVVNVKAVVENALTVSTDSVEFGDVIYPSIQRPGFSNASVTVSLADSFVASDRLEGVSYVLKLKPKVKLSCDSPQAPQPCEPLKAPYPGDPWADVVIGSSTVPAWQYCEENLPEDASTTDAVTYTVDLSNPYWQRCYLPLGGWLALVKSLAESSSSTATLPTMLATDFLTVDREVLAFHQPYVWNASGTSALATSSIAEGLLSKNASDTADVWFVGMASPCFYGFCKPGADDPGKQVPWDALYDPDPVQNDYYVPPFARLDPATEHYPYGADLWIEVTGFNYSTATPPALP